MWRLGGKVFLALSPQMMKNAIPEIITKCSQVLPEHPSCITFQNQILGLYLQGQAKEKEPKKATEKVQ